MVAQRRDCRNQLYDLGAGEAPSWARSARARRRVHSGVMLHRSGRLVGVYRCNVSTLPDGSLPVVPKMRVYLALEAVDQHRRGQASPAKRHAQTSITCDEGMSSNSGGNPKCWSTKRLSESMVAFDDNSTICPIAVPSSGRSDNPSSVTRSDTIGSDSKKLTTASGVSTSTTSYSLDWMNEILHLKQHHPATECYLCPRYNLLPMSPAHSSSSPPNPALVPAQPTSPSV